MFRADFVQGAKTHDLKNALDYTQYLKTHDEIRELLLKKQQELEESKEEKDSYVDTVATIKNQIQ